MHFKSLAITDQTVPSKSTHIDLIHAAAILDSKRDRDSRSVANGLTTVNMWSRNLENFPPITQAVVDIWANEDAKIPRAKQEKGYSNFIEGYIHDVEGTKHGCESNCLIIVHRVTGVRGKHLCIKTWLEF